MIEVVSGPEGPSLYIDGIRMAGPKPWGGGRTIASWPDFFDGARLVTEDSLAEALERLFVAYSVAFGQQADDGTEVKMLDAKATAGLIIEALKP